MIYNIEIDLKELSEKEKDYPWKKPDRCERCSSPRLWGHGFVEAFFEHFVAALYLRRYRCPECGGVIRMRPSGLFKRFRAGVNEIRESIDQRISKGKWPAVFSKSRQRHWLRALKNNVEAHLGLAAAKDLPKSFDALIGMGIIPVSRAR
jgi:hypothetical protein